MWAEPTDVEGECNARMSIADDYGDNSATIRCQLAAGHEGLHQEQYTRKGGTVTITWTFDERRRCDHGCGQWEHAHHEQAAICPKDSEDHDYASCALCHPGESPKTCSTCGQQHFLSERSHQYRCQKIDRETLERLKAQDDRDLFRDADSDAPSGA
jgi:hypothetical protein